MKKEIHILVVDDNRQNLTIVSNFLKEKNYKLALATDFTSAMKILKDNKIDLILLDVMMPVMDGFTVCRMLKENEETKGIPVIFLTAKAETEDIVKGFEVGGVDYITKPFNKEELYARVNNHIKLKLVRDLLEKQKQDSLASRDKFIYLLSELGNIMRSNN